MNNGEIKGVAIMEEFELQDSTDVYKKITINFPNRVMRFTIAFGKVAYSEEEYNKTRPRKRRKI